MKTGCHFFLLLFLFLYTPMLIGKTSALTIDIDNDEVNMNLNYMGGNLTVFGTVDEGENVAIVVLGPRDDVVLYEKVRSFGIWTNRIMGKFGDVPSYYYLSANNRFLLLEDMPQGQFLIKDEIGVEHIRISGENRGNEKKRIIETMQEKSLYSENHNGVTLVDKNLFKAKIPIPKSAPAGIYTLKVFTFGADNYINEKRTLPIFVHKAGVVAIISHYARTNAQLYGIAVILISLIVGLLTVLVLRRLKS